MSTTRTHGVKGAYVAGDWVPIEECGEKFNIKNGSDNCGGDCSACPRSRSKKSAAKKDGSYDVVIIGAGCIGSAIARELSKTNASVLLLEAADDVTQGATKGNSGIVHAGYDDKPGSVRAKYCWNGNQMFSKLDSELHFGYQRNGSLVLARGKEEEKVLEDLMKRGKQNGVKRLKIVNRKELLEMEPHVDQNVTAALYSPDAGNLIPYEYAIALAENAVDNGVEVRIRREVTAIQSVKESGNEKFMISVNHWEPSQYLKSLNTQTQTPNTIGNLLNYLLYPILAANIGRFLCTYLITQIPEITSKPTDFTTEEALMTYVKENQNLILIVITSLCAVGAAIVVMVVQSGLFKGFKEESWNKVPPEGSGGRLVTVDEMKVGGSGSCTAVGGEIVGKEQIEARFIVNAAGCYSDKISEMIGDCSFKIKPRLGNYILLHKNQGHLARHTLFPCPHPVLGKGVLVQTTLWGNLILGPTARDMHLPEVQAETTDDIFHYILSKCKQLVPSFDPKTIIHSFSGARAKNTSGDWVIGPSEKNSRFIQAAGIDSPGLAGSPAIALDVVKMLHDSGLEKTVNKSFNPLRAPIIFPKDGWKGIKAGPVGKYTDPAENVICKCEKVTEKEVVTALHRSLPIDSTQAIRKRTRAGMGPCQAKEDNYNCECRVAAIIARETGIPVSAVGRRPWPATSSLNNRWPEESELEHIDKLAKE